MSSVCSGNKGQLCPQKSGAGGGSPGRAGLGLLGQLDPLGRVSAAPLGPRKPEEPMGVGGRAGGQAQVSREAVQAPTGSQPSLSPGVHLHIQSGG